MAIQKGFPSVIKFGTDGNDNYLGTYISLAALQLAFPTAQEGNFAYVDAVGIDTQNYVWDNTDSQWTLTGGVSGVVEVNSKTGSIITLVTDDIDDSTSGNKWSTIGEKTKLAFITITQAINLDNVTSALADAVYKTGTQTITGLKTFNLLTIAASVINLTNPVTIFKKLTAGSTSVTIEGNGLTNAAILNLLNGDGAGKEIILSALQNSAQIDLGAGYSALIINGANLDKDFFIRGATNQNLFVVDAGNNNVGIGGIPNLNSILDLQSTTKAFLPPRLTTVQRDAIVTKVAGMIIYNSTLNQLQNWNGISWSGSSAYAKTSGEWRIVGINGVGTPLVQNVPAKLLTGGLDVGVALHGVTKPLTNRLQVNEPEVADFKISVSLGMERNGGGNNDYNFSVYMDGLPLPIPITARWSKFIDGIVSFSGTAQNVSAGIHNFEIWAENISSGTGLIVFNGTVSVERTF